VVLFLVVWVALHPAQAPSVEIRYLGAGAALVLAGGLLRGFASPGGPLRAAGTVALPLGIAVAGGPWWIGLLLLPALLPMSLVWLRPDAPPCLKTLPLWGRESLAVGAALLAIAAMRAMQGLIPIG